MNASHLPIPANRELSLSPDGRRQLSRREAVIRHYYNDQVNNCTYGVGTLEHLGPCTEEELRTRVTDEQIARSFQQGIDTAANAVQRNVTDTQLTQAQFDALVSFAYNVGAGGARNVLRQVNAGQFERAAQDMRQYTHARVYGPDGQPVRDEQGRIVTRVVHDLIIRRQEESAPLLEVRGQR